MKQIFIKPTAHRFFFFFFFHNHQIAVHSRIPVKRQMRFLSLLFRQVDDEQFRLIPNGNRTIKLWTGSCLPNPVL